MDKPIKRRKQQAMSNELTIDSAANDDEEFEYGTLYCEGCKRPMPQTAIPAASAKCADCCSEYRVIEE